MAAQKGADRQAVERAFFAEFPTVIGRLSSSLDSFAKDQVSDSSDSLPLIRVASRMILGSVRPVADCDGILDALALSCENGSTQFILGNLARGLSALKARERLPWLTAISKRPALAGKTGFQWLGLADRNGAEKITGLAVWASCGNNGFSSGSVKAILDMFGEAMEWGAGANMIPFGFVAFSALEGVNSLTGSLPNLSSIGDETLSLLPSGFVTGLAAQYKAGSGSRTRLVSHLTSRLGGMEWNERRDFAKIVWLGGDKGEALDLLARDRPALEAAAVDVATPAFDGLGDIDSSKGCGKSAWLAAGLRSMGMGPLDGFLSRTDKSVSQALLGCLAHLEASELSKAAARAPKGCAARPKTGVRRAKTL